MDDGFDIVRRARVQGLFDDPGFITEVGIRFVGCGRGWCETRLELAPRHLQHTGVVHAGVAATMADHTAGASSMTTMTAGHVPVTVEFKIHLLRAAKGTHLECRGDVLKDGARFVVAEATVFAVDAASRVAVAKLIATMAPVADAR